jgi:hypothetical protein
MKVWRRIVHPAKHHAALVKMIQNGVTGQAQIGVFTDLQAHWSYFEAPFV